MISFVCIKMEDIIMAKYRKLNISLTEEQRKSLESKVKKGKCSATEIRRTNVILMADDSSGKGMKDVDIAASLSITPQAVHNIKVKFLESDIKEENKDASDGVKRKKRETPPVPPKVTGDVEAKIIALACSTPPEGRSKWTLRLLSEKSVELEIIDSISHMQVSRILKKTNINLT